MSTANHEQEVHEAQPGMDFLPLQQAVQARAQSPRSAIPADASAPADAELTSVYASPNQTPPAKTRRQESPSQRTQPAPWPMHPHRPPQLPTGTSSSTRVHVAEYTIEEQHSASDEEIVVQETHQSFRRSGSVPILNRFRLQKRRFQGVRHRPHAKKTVSEQPSHALAPASASSQMPTAMAPASALQEQQGMFGGNLGDFQLLVQQQVAAATEAQAQEDNRFWEGQMSALMQRARAAELENQNLRAEAQQREQGFRHAAAQYQHEAAATADQYQAIAATVNAQAESRAESAERRATQSRQNLVQTREEVRMYSIRHEQEHQAQALRTSQVHQEAQQYVHQIAHEAQQHVQHHEGLAQRITQEVEAKVQAQLTEARAELEAVHKQNHKLQQELIEEEEACVQVVEERDDEFEKHKATLKSFENYRNLMSQSFVATTAAAVSAKAPADAQPPPVSLLGHAVSVAKANQSRQPPIQCRLPHQAPASSQLPVAPKLQTVRPQNVSPIPQELQQRPHRSPYIVPVNGWHLHLGTATAPADARQRYTLHQLRAFDFRDLDPHIIGTFWFNRQDHPLQAPIILGEGTCPHTGQVDAVVEMAFKQLHLRSMIHHTFCGEHEYVSKPWETDKVPCTNALFPPDVEEGSQQAFNLSRAIQAQLQFWSKVQDEIDTPRQNDRGGALYNDPELTWADDVQARTPFIDFYKKRVARYWHTLDHYKSQGRASYQDLYRNAASLDKGDLNRTKIWDHSVVTILPDDEMPPDTTFTRFLDRDILYSWLDKHAERSVYLDQRQPKKNLFRDAEVRNWPSIISMPNHQSDNDNDDNNQDPRPPRGNAKATADAGRDGRPQEHEEVDDARSLVFSVSNASQPPAPADATSPPATNSFSVIRSPIRPAMYYIGDADADSHAFAPASATSPDAIAPASAQPVLDAFATASAGPEAQIASFLAKYESNVSLPSPGPDQATCERWRLKSELKLLKFTNNPDGVRKWWRDIYDEPDEQKLARTNGQAQLDGKILDEVLKLMPPDLRKDVMQENKKRHRAGQPTLNGQQTLRKWYNSLKGTSHEKCLHFMRKFYTLRMENNDLRGYNRALDDITDELEGTALEVLTTNKEIMCVQYLKEVRHHPWMKHHMAIWTTMPHAEQTYEWLRKTVQRVLDEHVIVENDKAWQPRVKNMVVATSAPKKRTQGLCPSWRKHGRCSTPNCPYEHVGPAAEPRKNARAPAHANNRGRDRRQSSRGSRGSQGFQRKRSNTPRSRGTSNSSKRSSSNRSNRSSGSRRNAFAPASAGSRSRSQSGSNRHSSKPGSVSSGKSTPRNGSTRNQNPKWCKFYMKGICKNKDKTCNYTHPEVCQKWRKGLCQKSNCQQLHGERPVQRARKNISAHNLTNEAANASSPAKKQKSSRNSRSSSSKSNGSANGRGKKDKKTKKESKSTKKDSGHAKAKQQSHPQ